MKKICTIICALTLLVVAILPTAANSAQVHWQGTDATGAIISDKSCPVVVEKEVLTFDLEQFPESYYSNVDEYLGYTGKVTAEYTFYNPADYTVTARLLFPFGTQPDYVSLYNSESGIRVDHADTEKYDITVDGKAIDKTLRYSLSEFYRQFELKRDLSLLHDGLIKDDFYSPDLPVTVYLYSVEGVDTEKYPAATVAFDIAETDYPDSRLILQDQTGSHFIKSSNAQRMGIDAENGQKIVLWVIGKPLSKPLEWKFYKNGGVENKDRIDGSITNYEIETMTFHEFAMEGWFEEHTTVSESDWYNAKVAILKDAEETSFGSMIYLWHTNFNSPLLMRWYEYEISLEPGQRIVNTVTAPIYPAIDRSYEPGIYEYTYLLSPAATWADFGELEIVVNTPHFLIEGMESAQKTENGYIMRHSGLPDGELVFSLSKSQTPKRPIPQVTDYIPIEIIISFSVIGGALLLIVGGIVAIVVIRRKRGCLKF